jgi:hypothetical protein
MADSNLKMLITKPGSTKKAMDWRGFNLRDSSVGILTLEQNGIKTLLPKN